ncbi:energy-coupling factor transporter transmembrane component T [Clostridium oceanicum]|uniref:Energy-coupling factor transporter transmembrane protein EcfT n=1 Tax=Clostridium oceanicum TaxID=1543 RepID=A0ABP3UXC6_9CLOT
MKSQNKLEFSLLTKLIILILTILGTFLLENVKYMPILFLGLTCNFLIQRKYKILKSYIPLYLILSIIRYLSHKYMLPIIVFSEFYVFIFWWLTPIFMAMQDVMTTSPGIISSFLSKIHVSKSFILGVLVTCRFIPTVRSAIKGIRESMHNRDLTGIKNLILRPLKTYEYVLVPMLMMSINTADQLSASAMVRGVQAPCNRGSYYCDEKGFKDCIGITIIIFVFCYILQKGGIK